MCEEKVRHVRRPVSDEQVECLVVRHVAVVTPDPVLQMVWITSVLQQIFIVVRLKECRVTLLEVPDNMFARATNIREDTYFDI